MVKFLVNLSLKSIFFFFFLTNFQLHANDPNIRVFKTLDQLHTMIKKICIKEITQSEIVSIEEVISKTYDIKKMSKIILSRYWVEHKTEENNKFIEVFTSYISRNYLKRFDKVKSIDIVYKSVEDIGENYKVAQVSYKFNNTDNLNLNYMLIKNKEEWLIFDVLINGSISEVATKKSEFAETLKLGGIRSLIDLISNKFLL